MFFFNFFSFLNIFKKKFNLFSFFNEKSYKAFFKNIDMDAGDGKFGFSQKLFNASQVKKFGFFVFLKKVVVSTVSWFFLKFNINYGLVTNSDTPYKFAVIYKNYVFFSKYSNFEKSFKTLNDYWKSNYNFLVFSFFYLFFFYRFRTIQNVVNKTGKIIDFFFQEFFFLTFLTLANVRISTTNVYINKPVNNIKNFNNLRAQYTPDNLVNVNMNYKVTSKYKLIFEKYGFLKNNFYKNSVISFLKIFNSNNFLFTAVSNFKKNYTIIFSNTFLYKYIRLNQVNQYVVYFLRKTRFFNKGRYSRNRQNYRTGVYWCLYVNIVAVLTIYYFFFRFSFNFGYLWWLFAASVNCFFFSKFIKYKFNNFNNLMNNFNNLIRFYTTIFFSFKHFFTQCKYKRIILNLSKISNYLISSRLKLYFINLYSYIIKLFFIIC